MATLNQKIKVYLLNNNKIYQEEKNNYQIQNDGDGDYLVSWNVSGLTEPTTDQLNSLNSDAETLENNNVIRSKRKKAYGDIGDQLDEIFKDIDSWKERIAKVKADNPKEE
tara:strand:+ start:199 stop:528 length:330 start_codon:yes stop_codon:yes gene_type:complete